MELMDIYKNAENPIDNIDIIKKLVLLYSESDHKRYYSKLVRANNTTDSGRYYIKDEDEFYSMLFNIWKRNIITMTKDEFIELYKRGFLKQDFIQLRKYLFSVPDLTTKKEVFDVLYSPKENKEVEEAIDRYRWTAFGEGGIWNHICSRYVHAKKDIYPEIEHRLYINTDTDAIYKLNNYFIKKCEESKIPYYFKYCLGDTRDDSMVIYSSTEDLNKYIEILQEILKEHKELEARINKPPILSAPIDGWIGYASSPYYEDEKDAVSFNELRGNIIEEAIVNVTGDWVKAHKDMVINYQGRQTRFDDYILMTAANRFVHKLQKRYYDIEIMCRQEALDQRRNLDVNEVIERAGYTIEGVSNPKFLGKIYRLLQDKKDEYMNAIITGNYDNVGEIKMTIISDINYNNKKQSFASKKTFSFRDMDESFKSIIPKIIKYEPSYITRIQENIKRIAPLYGVDPNNFSFDKKRVDGMIEYDKKHPNTTHSNELSEMLKVEVKRPRERKIEETDEEYERYLKEFYGGNSLV